MIASLNEAIWMNDEEETKKVLNSDNCQNPLKLRLIFLYRNMREKGEIVLTRNGQQSIVDNETVNYIELPKSKHLGDWCEAKVHLWNWSTLMEKV